jgi:hypothetical protein
MLHLVFRLFAYLADTTTIIVLMSKVQPPTFVLPISKDKRVVASKKSLESDLARLHSWTGKLTPPANPVDNPDVQRCTGFGKPHEQRTS